MNAALEIPDKVWTYEDYLELDDDLRREIIEGQLLMSPAPELYHQRWVGGLFRAFQNHVDDIDSGEILVAPLDVILDRHNVVQPDLIFVSKTNSGILQRRGVMGTPDLVVEVISAGSLRRDRYEKREIYSRFGVKEYWLADVANRSIEVLSWTPNGYRLLSCATEEGKVKSEVLAGFELDLATLG